MAWDGTRDGEERSVAGMPRDVRSGGTATCVLARRPRVRSALAVVCCVVLAATHPEPRRRSTSERG